MSTRRRTLAASQRPTAPRGKKGSVKPSASGKSARALENRLTTDVEETAQFLDDAAQIDEENAQIDEEITDALDGLTFNEGAVGAEEEVPRYEAPRQHATEKRPAITEAQRRRAYKEVMEMKPAEQYGIPVTMERWRSNWATKESEERSKHRERERKNGQMTTAPRTSGAARNFEPGTVMDVDGVEWQLTRGLRKAPAPTPGRVDDPLKEDAAIALFMSMHPQCVANSGYTDQEFQTALKDYIANVNTLKGLEINARQVVGIFDVLARIGKIPNAVSQHIERAVNLEFQPVTNTADYAHVGVRAKLKNDLKNSLLWAAVSANCVKGFRLEEFFDAFTTVVDALKDKSYDKLLAALQLPSSALSARQIEDIEQHYRKATYDYVRLSKLSFIDYVTRFLLGSPDCVVLLSADTQRRKEFLSDTATFIGMALSPTTTAEILQQVFSLVAPTLNVSPAEPSKRHYIVNRESVNQSMPAFNFIETAEGLKIPFMWHIPQVFCANPNGLKKLIAVLANVLYRKVNAPLAAGVEAAQKIQRATPADKSFYYDTDNFGIPTQAQIADARAKAKAQTKPRAHR